MKFFIDTANLDQIREANELGVLDGVTTNPSLMAKEGIKGIENQRRHYIKICEMVDGDVSAEVIATDYEGMIKEGEELAGLNPHIVVKVPCIEAGIKAIKYFQVKASVRIVRLSFLRDRHCWRPKRVRRMFLLLSAVWTTLRVTESNWCVRLLRCTITTITRRRCWQPPSVLHSISFSAWKPEPMWQPVRFLLSKAY